MKKVVFLLLAIIILLGMMTKGIFGYFSDEETSAGNTFCAWQIITLTLLDDGFEGTPWDGNWDDNGATDWQHADSPVHSGSYSANCYKGDTYLTTDDLDTSGASSITVSFWFYIKDLNKGPLYVQTYNGTSYNNWHDPFTYPGAVKNTWLFFSETITDSQYFRADFRLRFDGSGMNTHTYIDDVLVTIDQRL